MAITDYLDSTADLRTSGETVDPVTRRPIPDATADHTGVPVRLVHRRAASTVYDESGQVITDYDCLIGPGVTLTEGDVIVATAGPVTGEFVVTGEAVVGRGRSGAAVHHLQVPCRRVG